jgi:hypothetical protein
LLLWLLRDDVGNAEFHEREEDLAAAEAVQKVQHKFGCRAVYI